MDWRERSLSSPGEVLEELQVMLGEVAELPEVLRARLQAEAGLAAARSSRNRLAREYLEASLPVLDSAGLACGAAWRALGAVFGDLGESSSAWSAYARALAASEKEGNAFDIAACHNNMGNLAHYGGDDSASLKHFRRALAGFREIGHTIGMLVVGPNLASILVALESYEEAESLYAELEQLARAEGDERSLASILHNVGELHAKRGVAEKARACFRESEDLHRRLGLAGEAALSGAHLAVQLARIGEARAEDVALEVARSLDAGEVESARYEIGASLQLAVYFDARPESEEWLRRAAEKALAGGFRVERIEALETLAQHCRRAGDFEAAFAYLEEAMEEERALQRERSASALRRQQALLEVDRAREQAELARAHQRELEAINAELAASRDEAQRQAAAKGWFLSVMSHELRTPVNAIHGAACLLAGNLANERRAQCMDLIKGASESLLAVVNQQLDLARLEIGKAELSQEVFELRPWLRSILLTVAPSAAAKDLLLLADLPLDFPERIGADRFRLRQIVLNLLSNAVRYTAHGAVILRIGPGPDPDWLRIEVEDTGPGLDAAEQARIFGVFEQGKNRERGVGSSGLGLAICEFWVRHLGGHISVRSEPGIGSTFQVDVPVEGLGSCRPFTVPAMTAVVLKTDSPALRKWVEGAARDGGVRLVSDEEAPEDALWIIDSRQSMSSTDGLENCVVLDREGFSTRGSTAVGSLARVVLLPCLPEDLWSRSTSGEEGDDSSLEVPLARELGALDILIVDDDAPSRAMLEALLETWGFSVITAADGVEALSCLANKRFDLVLSDLHMPRMDGAALAGEALARGIGPGAFVLVSATAGDLVRNWAGVDAYLSKPLLPEELASLLRRFVSGASRDGLVGSTDWKIEKTKRPIPEGLVDLALWRQYAGLLGRSRFLELLHGAVKEMEGALESWQGQLVASDRESMARSAHRLAGIAAHFGFSGVSLLASELELAVLQKDLPDTFLRDGSRLRELLALSLATARGFAREEELRP